MGSAVTFSWIRAAEKLRQFSADDAGKPPELQRLDRGQRDSLAWISERLVKGGLVLADEVGTGKTRIACAVVHAVLAAGGRAAVVVPHGIMHQWVFESAALGNDIARPKQLTTLTDFFRECAGGDMSWRAAAPRVGTPEWWLVSHGFRAPLVRVDSHEWRAALPSFVHMELTSRTERDDRRTWAGALERWIGERPPAHWLWHGMHRIGRDVAPRVRGDRALRARIMSLPRLSATGGTSGLMAVFGAKGDGRPVTERLLGLWLGSFDLIVVDEAHKSRGEDDTDTDGSAAGAVSGTVLQRLIDSLLVQPETGRRICMTATPMELNLEQWLGLLARSRCALDAAPARQAIARLADATTSAAIAPDEGARLDELCAAAREFQRALGPYVTRRRRTEDGSIREFATKLDDARARLPHPHRNVESVPIGWAQTVGRRSPWLDVLFAAECMSKSAQGLTLADTEGWPRAVRDAYTKLSAGHVSLDLSETAEPLRVPEPGSVADHTRGKIARVAYWYRRLREGRRRIAEEHATSAVELDPDAEHPRILAAAKEIERWTNQSEKVLVFGVFLQPLRLLRDVLNVRAALRAADADRPISHSIGADPALLGIAVRHMERLRADGALPGRLASAGVSELRRALADGHKAYERLRRRVRKEVHRHLAAWRAAPDLLGGASPDEELDEALEDHLVSFLLDDFLASASPTDPSRERIDVLASEFTDRHLRVLFSEQATEDMGEEDQAELRQATLRRVLLDDDHDARQSHHARLLQGKTKWDTRRYIQAAFNRPSASPRVLVAQSQVGREGLNLHESCRVVVQFHAEWNPAVLEQQIGRVDRKGSLWERRAQAWLAGGAQGPPPFIEVRQLTFEGTYDAFQWERVMRRQHVFDASLFGSLLPSAAWQRVPSHRVQELTEAAPSFRPSG